MTLPAKITITAAIFMAASFVWGLIGTFWFAVGVVVLIFAALALAIVILCADTRPDLGGSADTADHLAHDVAYGHRPTPAFLARFEGLDAERERLATAANLNASKRN